MPWAPDYVDPDVLADFVRVNLDNPYVGTYGTAASRAIDGFTNRQFGQLATAAAFTYDGAAAALLPDSCRWWLPIDDVQDLTGLIVVVGGTTITAGADGYQLWPRNEVAKGRPYTGLTFADRPVGDVDVTAKFGWSTIPAGVTGANWLQVNRWNIRRESPYGIAGAPSEGSEIRLSTLLDPDVRAMLSGGQLVRVRMPR